MLSMNKITEMWRAVLREKTETISTSHRLPKRFFLESILTTISRFVKVLCMYRDNNFSDATFAIIIIFYTVTTQAANAMYTKNCFSQ